VGECEGESFAEWAAEWLATSIHLKPKTRLSYEAVLRRYLLPAFADWPIDDITQRHVRRAVASWSQAGIAPGTVSSIYSVLRSVMSSAKAAGLIGLNPCSGVRMPRAEQREMLFLDASQVLALSRAIIVPYPTLILFAAYTGCRAGEIGALRMRRLDLDAGKAHIRESLADVNGQMMFGTTKTYSNRSLALPTFLVDELRAYLRDRPSGPDDLVFTSPRLTPIRQNAFLVRYFKPAVRRAGLPAGLRFHDLRHTCVALLVAQGAHPRAIMERLGHSSIEMTLGRYGHLFPSLDDGLVDGLQAAYEAAAQSGDTPPVST